MYPALLVAIVAITAGGEPSAAPPTKAQPAALEARPVPPAEWPATPEVIDPPGRRYTHLFSPIIRNPPSPGTVRNPSGSWWKLSYLAYRDNFFTGGYDYRRELNYPWHAPRGCCGGPPALQGRPGLRQGPPELMPTPAAEQR